MSEFFIGMIGVLLLGLLLWNFMEAIGGAFGALVVSAARRLQKAWFGIDGPLTGADALVGKEAMVERDFVLEDHTGVAEGYVVLDGERWRARSVGRTGSYVSGERLSVRGREGLVLLVGQGEVE